MLSSELLATMDDAVGMIDFEIGSRADRFIGAPFSSFSVMIALKRARRQLPEPPGSRYDVTLAPDEHSPGTLMAAGADTADKLAANFAVAFPFAAAIPEDPCKELVALHPSFAKARLASCPVRTLRTCHPGPRRVGAQQRGPLYDDRGYFCWCLSVMCVYVCVLCVFTLEP